MEQNWRIVNGIGCRKCCEVSPDKTRRDHIRESSNTKDVNCKVCWTHGDIRSHWWPSGYSRRLSDMECTVMIWRSWVRTPVGSKLRSTSVLSRTWTKNINIHIYLHFIMLCSAQCFCPSHQILLLSVSRRSCVCSSKRRGAINAKQLSYLEKYRPKSRLKSKNGKHGGCLIMWTTCSFILKKTKVFDVGY